MNIKIECPCGTRYSFDVEPQDGRIPFAVSCPNCKADGNAAANEIIAQGAAAAVQERPRLRVQSSHAVPALPVSEIPADSDSVEAADVGPPPAVEFCSRHPGKPAAEHCAVCGKPICADCMATFGYLCSVTCRYEAETKRIDVPVYKGQRRRVEDRTSRMGVRITGAVFLLMLLGLGAWIWYSFVGSKPRVADSLHLAEPQTGLTMQFVGPKQLLIVSAERAAIHDFSTRKDLWSTSLQDNALKSGAAPDVFPGSTAPLPKYILDNDSIWICLGNSVKRLDRSSGAIKQTVPIPNQFVSFAAADSNLLVVSAADETRRLVTRIDLSSGETKSQEIVVPRSEKHNMPNDLPPNVQPTADVLLAQALDEQKFGKALDAVSSQFFSAGQNLVELRVKLLEPKVTWVQTIKPRGPSALNGATVSTSAADVEEEVFNDLKRDRTGGVRGVDESRYEVRLRRWLDAEPVEWRGDVTGAPSFFSLDTVDLLTASRLDADAKPKGALFVFDKQNNPLFQAALAYPVSDRFTSNRVAFRRPAVRTSSALYFFDQGVLTAFALPGGEVQWRLPSVGISGVQFDSQGMLYVESTTAAPEDIQYTDQLRFDQIAPVILKVDPNSGKILWKAMDRGQTCFLSDKFVYSESLRKGGMGMTTALRGALGAPEEDGPVYFHLYRLDPATGEVIWNLYREQGPDQVAVQDDHFVLRFGGDLQLFKFLTFQ